MEKVKLTTRKIIELRFVESNDFMLELYDDGFIKVTENKKISNRLAKLGLHEEAEMYKLFPKTGVKTIRMVNDYSIKQKEAK